jgi:hypothetical protein
MAKTLAEKWVWTVGVTAFLTGTILSMVVPNFKYGDLPAVGIAGLGSAFIAVIGQYVAARWIEGIWLSPGAGDVLGLLLALSGFLLAWGLTVQGIPDGIIDAIGAVLAAGGLYMGYELQSPIDDLMPSVGYLDEFVSAFFTGWSMTDAFQSNL